MTSKLARRIVKMERRTAPVDISKWWNTPIESMPDWVLLSIILDRPVSAAETHALDKDDEVSRQIEMLCAIGEENDEFYAVRGELIDYVERNQHRASKILMSGVG